MTFKIYGKDIGAVKGKSVRQTPSHVDNYTTITIPPRILNNYQSLTICIGIFYFDNIIYFASISRGINLITTEPILSRSEPILKTAMKNIISLYNSRGFRVKFVHADDKFVVLEIFLLERRIVLNLATVNEHVPEIERVIRLIKERVRCTISTLPYRRMPTLVKKYLLTREVFLLNMFPRKGGVSNIFGTRPLVHGTLPDYRVYCKIPFGAYCEVFDEPHPSNTATSRTTGATTLSYSDNIQGRYYFMSLSTGKRLSRRQ